MTRRPAADAGLVVGIRTALADAGDPVAAPAMQRYMKSALPFRGVRMPVTRRLTRTCVDRWPPADRGTWEATVRELYDGATQREERYAALVVAGHRCARPWQDSETLGLYRHLVVSGAWWDLVDWTATALVAPVLRAAQSEVAPVMREWAVDGDLWVRRAAVLCQVGAKDDVDLPLLAHCIEANLPSPEPWLRKACGWALRDAAYRHPDWVRDFVSGHAEVMSGLTTREATRHLEGVRGAGRA